MVQDWILGWNRIGSGLAKEWLRIGQGLVLDWPHVDADLVLLRAFRPPSRLGTIPYRRLVPWLDAHLSSDCLGLARNLPMHANELPILSQSI